MFDALTVGRFFGSQALPGVYIVGPEPGQGWEPVADMPAQLEPGIGLAILSGGQIKGLILEKYAGKRLSKLASSTSRECFTSHLHST